MIKLTKTKIGWTGYCWNPVLGCNKGCSFCYARKMAKRFGGVWAKKELEFVIRHKVEYDISVIGNTVFDKAEWQNRHLALKQIIENFKPIFMNKNFYKEFPKKPGRIFVNSMSDIKFWKEEWMKKVLDKIRQYPQHRFLFLTKFPEVYEKYHFPGICWLGVTITNQEDLEKRIPFATRRNTRFVSIEPIHGPVDLSKRHSAYGHFITYLNWTIVGRETGNCKNKIIANRDWIDEIISDTRAFSSPLWMKENLKPMYKNLIQELPDE